LAGSGFALEHFYHGQLAMGGRFAGDVRLLAASKGVSPELATEITREALVPASSESTVGALALVRTKASPFVFVQSVIRGGTLPFRHFVLVTPDALRALSGNLRGVLALAQSTFPTYEMTGQVLSPVVMHATATPTDEQQEQSMLNLMTITRDRLDAIESMLAAIIQGVPIDVRGAPPELPKRVTLIEGLLSLLPPPARYGVTFATHSDGGSRLDAQVRFVTDDAPVSPDALGYVWGDPKTTGRRLEDGYARFIKSQLRLDTALVIERTRALTPVAGWRLKRGDSMSDALDYGSYRLRMDEALLNSQPVGAAEAARVLAEDPTLNDELRGAYIRHLLAFALAMDEDENTDLLTVVAKGQPELERVIIEEMRKALVAGKGDVVYRRVARWLAKQGSFKGMYWIDLLQRAAVVYAENCARAGSIDELTALLADVRSAPNAGDFTPILPQLLDIALPLAPQSRALAETLFALAATSLPADQLQRVTMNRSLTDQLPAPLGQVARAMITRGAGETPPPGLVAQAVSEFSPQWQPLVAIRLAELITLNGAYDLLDGAAMETVTRAAMSTWGITFDGTLRWMARMLSTEEALNAMDARARMAVPQILLARRAFPDFVTELIRHQRGFYPGDRQVQFATAVHGLFRDTRLSIEDTGSALAALADRNIKPLPLVMAYFGALAQHNWSPDMASRAAELTTLIFNNRLVAEALPPEHLSELLMFHVERRDQGQALRVANLLPATAARKGDAGLATMITLVKHLNWSPEVSAAGLEALRRYVRRSPAAGTPARLNRLGRELGEEIRTALEATLLMSTLMGGEQMGDYAYTLHTVAQFMYETYNSYRDRNNLPTISSLLGDLDSLSVSINNEERRELAGEMLSLMRNIHALAERHRATTPKEPPERIDALLSGTANATSVIDIFRVMGGYFARGKRLAMSPEKLILVHPLGDRASHNLLREIQQINRLLANALSAVPPGAKFSISAQSLQGDIESLWSDLSLNERRTLVRDLAIDLQRIPELALLMTERVDQRILQDDSGLSKKLAANRQKPETTFEFYRFCHGFFAGSVR
jgi:hypothetical protein